MLSIKLARHGKKHQPMFRIVVIDHKKPATGAFIEVIGHYNPATEPSSFVIKSDRYDHWVSKGAQPSGTVKKLARLNAAAKTAAAPAGEAAAPAKKKAAPAKKKPAAKAD
jgi:small subunit ribosomal protein S16